MYRDESRNFYYDIKITSPDGKRSARLTQNILKLCNKIDIVEALVSGGKQGEMSTPSATVNFIEADFLPDSGNKTPIEGVDGRGYITNRTGALIDLRFDSEKGFTYVTPQELESGYTKSSRTKSNESEPVIFLFDYNNKIEITWGHLEPRTSRTVRFKIGAVNYASGQGGNVLSLQCVPTALDMSRTKLNEGKLFVDNEGKPETLKQILYTISLVFGARLEFDGNDVPTKPDPSTTYVLNRTIVGGDTLPSEDGAPVQFVRQKDLHSQVAKLAKDYNSIYEIYDDPITGTPVIKFTSEAIRFEKVDYELNYRDPDGVMLDFQLSTVAGRTDKSTSTSAISEKGRAGSEYVEVQVTDGRSRNTGEVPRTFDPIPLVYNERARKLLSRELYGDSKTAPSTDRSELEAMSDTGTRNSSYMSTLGFKTVGHPDFTPGVYDIKGIGVRHSTTYRVFTVQHSMSSAGYTCSMQGKTQKTVESGVSNQEQLKGNNEYESVQLTTGRE